MKKTLAVLLATLMVLACFSGCGNTAAPSESGSTAPSESGSEPASEATGDKAFPDTTLTFWHYYSGSTGEDVTTLFNQYAEQPDRSNIKLDVVFVPFGDLKKQLSVGTAAGTLPDLVLIDNCDNVAYSAMGIFADITDVMASEENLKDYYEQIIATTMYEGKQYSVPFMSNNQGIWYNKDMFEAAGITKIPESYEEIRDAAKKLTKDGVYGFGMSAVQNEEGTSQFLPFQIASSGDAYDPYKLDSEGGLRALKFLTSMVEDGSMPKDVVAWSQSDVGTQFSNQKIAMMMMGCWYITEYRTNWPDLNWGVFPIKDKTFGTIYGGENLAAIDGEDKEVAIDFLKWYIQYDVSKPWNLLNDHFPPRDATLSDPDYQTEDWKVFVDLIPYTIARPADVKYPEVSTGHQLALQEALTLAKSPEEAVKDGQAVIDAALA